MALARFEMPSHLQFASLGNIEARSWSTHECISFPTRRGFLGAQENDPRTQGFVWHPDSLLVLHTDGLEAQWQWSDFPGIHKDPAQTVAMKLMRALGKEHDDATVLVVRGPAS
jgi:hypothetical protein